MHNYVKIENISLKNHLEINEKWVQQKIQEDPTILGLGDLRVRDSERIQKTGGRLDILLQDDATNTRYEVELQLGKVDETHIIRTLEYWDIERKKYPQYEHVAVIISEDITSRFLNVISLFNGHIPLIAIQMNAVKFGNDLGLVFTKVLDVALLGTEEEDIQEITDRNYWERTATKETLKMVDELFAYIETFTTNYSLRYNKYYIGLFSDGVAKNFVTFNPRKTAVVLNIKHKQNDNMDELLNNCDLEKLSYDRLYGQYRVRLYKKDIVNNRELLIQLMKMGYESYTGNEIE